MAWLGGNKIVIRPRTGETDFFNFIPLKAVRPLPPTKVLLFFIIILLWLAFGILGRDPWKPEETFLSLIALQMADAQLLLNPSLLGVALTEYPPLYLWVIALSAKFLPLEPHESARLANVFLLSLSFYFIHAATKKNYGNRVAWLSLLLVIGTVGFLVRGHQITFGIAAFSGAATVIYGYTALTRPAIYSLSKLALGAFILLSGILFLMFSVGIIVALLSLIAVCLSLLRLKKFKLPIALFIALTLSFAAWLSTDTFAYLPMQKLAIFAKHFSLLSHLFDHIILIAWALFPTLPLAAVAIYLQTHVNDDFLKFIILFCGFLFIYTFITKSSEENIFILIPALSVLASRALQKTSDDVAFILDSFALLVVGVLFVAGIWLFTLSFIFDWAQITRTLTSSLGNFKFVSPKPLNVIAAVALTALWVHLLMRTTRSNERAIVNWSCGTSLVWILFCLMLLPSVDAIKSYRPLSQAVLQKSEGRCISTNGINQHMTAQLIYFGNQVGKDCPLMLSPTSPTATADVIWQGGRPNDTTVYLTSHQPNI